jgi:hypothetical protein
VQMSGTGNIQKKEPRPCVNHYHFHILDPEWGHITIKMSGHPPFGAQVMLNGHEYVACQARKEKVEFSKEGNCFIHTPNAAGLARVADTLSEQPATGYAKFASVGFITPVCYSPWIWRNRSGVRSSISIHLSDRVVAASAQLPVGPLQHLRRFYCRQAWNTPGTLRRDRKERRTALPFRTQRVRAQPGER